MLGYGFSSYYLFPHPCQPFSHTHLVMLVADPVPISRPELKTADRVPTVIVDCTMSMPGILVRADLCSRLIKAAHYRTSASIHSATCCTAMPWASFHHSLPFSCTGNAQLPLLYCTGCTTGSSGNSQNPFPAPTNTAPGILPCCNSRRTRRAERPRRTAA